MGSYKIQAIAKNGLLTMEIANCPAPICMSCQIDKQRRVSVSKNGRGSPSKKIM